MSEVTFYHILSYVGAILLLGGSIVIFLQSRRNKADARALYALCFTLAAWGSVYLLACLNPNSVPLIDFDPMSVFTLLVGNLFIIICLLYPLEMAHPGWITPRRVIRLTIPGLGVILFYFGVLALLGQPIRPIQNIPDLITHMNEFNVWFRFALYLSVCFYIVYLLMNTSIRALEVRHNGQPVDTCLTRRLLLYGAGITLITASYLGVLLYGATALSMIVHRISVITVFTIMILTTYFCPTSTPQTPPKA